MDTKRISILDCTIRDGSYLINYQFTAEDTYLIAAALSSAGIGRIEVGHGFGLEAQFKGKGRAAEDDVRYVKAASDAVQGRSKIGVFFIPGIGSLESIEKASDAGLNFIRIGTNINRYHEAQSTIEFAKKQGLEVWSNLMKSYIVGPRDFAEVCKKMEGFGADVVVLVDSAGGMTPNQIRSYTHEACANISIPLGFHGHNNLQLVIANCLAFAEEGGSMVDGSLRGMGRSAGNAATEILAALFKREGYDIGEINWRRLMQLAQKLIAPGMPRDTGLLPIEIASGLSLFHSGFQPIVDQISRKTGVDPFEIILELGEESMATMTVEMAEDAARNARNNRSADLDRKPPDEQWVDRANCSTLEELKSTLQVLSAKTGYPVVMSLARPRRIMGAQFRIAPVRVGNYYCIGHVESVSECMDTDIIQQFSKDIDLWLLDRQIPDNDQLPDNAKQIRYDDDILLITALADMLRVKYPGQTLYLPEGDDRITQLISARFECGSKLPFDIGLAVSSEKPFSRVNLEQIRKEGAIILVLPDTIEPGVIEEARDRGMKIHRLDFGLSLISEASRAFNTMFYLDRHSGTLDLPGAGVVAGGIVGRKGEIVVNSISSPTTIIGKADGVGGLVPLVALHEEDQIKRRAVLNWMADKAEV